MKNKKVLVVLGGTSGERKVSLDSGRACVKALKKIGYNVSTFDPQKKPFSLIDRNKTNVLITPPVILRGRLGQNQSKMNQNAIFLLGAGPGRAQKNYSGPGRARAQNGQMK